MTSTAVLIVIAFIFSIITFVIIQPYVAVYVNYYFKNSSIETKLRTMLIITPIISTLPLISMVVYTVLRK